MTAERDLSGCETLRGGDCGSQPFPIDGRARRMRWAESSALTEWKIASQHVISRGLERVCNSNEEGRLAIGACAVREDKSMSVARARRVQVTAGLADAEGFELGRHLFGRDCRFDGLDRCYFGRRQLGRWICFGRWSVVIVVVRVFAVQLACPGPVYNDAENVVFT